MRLFVDCDDTLVLWTDASGAVEDDRGHPYGAGAKGWKPNEALIDCITRRRAEFETVIVWSGGGAEYAGKWLERLLPWADFCASKDIKLPRADDLCVDDATLTVAGRLITPQQFIEESRTPLDGGRQ